MNYTVWCISEGENVNTFVVAHKGKSVAGACGRISEPGRGSGSRGLELAAGHCDSVACRAARVRRSKGGADQEAGPVAKGHFMTSALLLARDCIIYSVNVWLVPVVCAFNIIESELVRRGVQLYPAE